ncbi:MAG: hypothetical protein IJI05_02325 [Erysipelotrichaceae bacterium]|nr:hypothetical protein [Erysipelotrichaceae bacterium]
MKNIILGEDGRYRWVYELPMLKNPVILMTVWRVLLISGLILAGFGLIMIAFEGFDPEAIKGLGLSLIIALSVLMLLAIPAYIIVAKTYDYGYTVLFEMDETGITHRIYDKKFKKAQVLSWLATAVGRVGNNLTTMGSGMMASERDTLSTDFASVRKIVPSRRLNLIRLEALFSHNQIYAEDEDFDFILDYLREHCPQAK